MALDPSDHHSGYVHGMSSIMSKTSRLA
jgi:hypothetical protein